MEMNKTIVNKVAGFLYMVTKYQSVSSVMVYLTGSIRVIYQQNGVIINCLGLPIHMVDLFTLYYKMLPVSTEERLRHLNNLVTKRIKYSGEECLGSLVECINTLGFTEKFEDRLEAIKLGFEESEVGWLIVEWWDL